MSPSGAGFGRGGGGQQRRGAQQSRGYRGQHNQCRGGQQNQGSQHNQGQGGRGSQQNQGYRGQQNQWQGGQHNQGRGSQQNQGYGGQQNQGYGGQQNQGCGGQQNQGQGGQYNQSRGNQHNQGRGNQQNQGQGRQQNQGQGHQQNQGQGHQQNQGQGHQQNQGLGGQQNQRQGGQHNQGQGGQQNQGQGGQYNQSRGGKQNQRGQQNQGRGSQQNQGQSSQFNQNRGGQQNQGRGGQHNRGQRGNQHNQRRQYHDGQSGGTTVGGNVTQNTNTTTQNMRGKQLIFRGARGRHRPFQQRQQSKSDDFVHISPDTTCPQSSPFSFKSILKLSAKSFLDNLSSAFSTNTESTIPNIPSTKKTFKLKSPKPNQSQQMNFTLGNEILENVATAKKKRPQRKPYIKPQQNKWRKKKPLPQEEKPVQLLSFECNQKSSAVISDDDDDGTSSTTLSRCSSLDTLDNLSDDSSDDSEISSIPSQAESATTMDVSVSDITGQCYAFPDRVISVFWDIENCPVPSQKSAVDVVKKIRETFYDRRSEDSFIVACDILNLSKQVDKELAECEVHLVHASSRNKNAADEKLKEFMLKFQTQYYKSDAAIVLITGDSDFSTVLYKMRYKSNIYINLVCKENSRPALISAAQNFTLFDDLVSDIPDRSKSQSQQVYVIISNIPEHVYPHAIKATLLQKLKLVNCKITDVSNAKAEIYCPNKSVADKVVRCIQGKDIFGSIAVATVELRELVSENEKKSKKKFKSSASENELKETKVDAFKQVDDASKVKKHKKVDQQNSKASMAANTEKISGGSTIYVYVNKQQGDEVYWKEKFKKLLKNSEFSLHWQSDTYLSCFLVKFPSLSKGQKARKILEQNALKGIDEPKFLKMVKEDANIVLPMMKELNLDNTAQKKIEEKIRCVDAKKSYYLAKFQMLWNSFKSKSENPEYQSSSNQNELNEQKVTFLNFSDNTRAKLRSLDTSSDNLNISIDEIIKDYYRECTCFENGLPIYGKKTTILRKIKQHQVVILEAETGSGKSTQLCQYLWREGFAEKGMIVCTQPRKIAAISIAKYVSNQVCSAVGNIVGYQVGMSKKISDQTKIQYTTDFTMLKLCAEDPLFGGMSCVVIDEAHERSIYTDLLLGMVKKAIKQRPDLKIVITSATLNVDLFQNYFSLPDQAVLRIPGRIFPIEDVFLDEAVTSGWDYFDKALNITYNILSEDPGDVLVFLPTPHETELAVKKFNDLVKKSSYKSKLLVYQLHGKLDLSEQQKIFDKTPNDARKIVFATNCAETSITIPGIKYVVDSGMVKEAQFDAVRNMNVLTVGFVNRSSAEQRRGRAGRTASGKCYRLYSRSNYENDMTENMLPEILRMNLGQALLKLLLFGLNPMEFEFIDSPPRANLTAALKQLIYLGAVEGDEMWNKLTDIGRQMALLPLEPRLCHLILKGIEEQIGFEAVVVAAIATTSRNVFFRNSENKDDADLKKVRFCHSESDFLTFLEVYKEWFEVPKQKKANWCVVNCINNRSMRLTQETVYEITTIFSKEFGISIQTKFSNDEECHRVLHKIIFQSFSENLCIFRGHKKLGYFHADSSLDMDEKLHIHPSSSLCSLGDSPPQFIVYDTLLKTSNTFLINVTTVSDEILNVAAVEGFLSKDLLLLESMVPKAVVFNGLGHYILSRFLGVKGSQLKTLEDQLQKLCGVAHCAVDVNFNLGCIKVYAPEQFHSIIEDALAPIIEGYQAALLKRDFVISNIASISSLSAVIGTGGEVLEIILPGEYRDVIVKPANINEAVVVKSLQKFGEIVFSKTSKQHKTITFRKIESAQAAVENSSKFEGFDVLPPKSYCPQENVAFFKVEITFLRRPCVGRAYFGILPPNNFVEVAPILLHKTLYYKSNLLNISISKKSPKDFVIQNLPSDVSNAELRPVIEAILPSGISLSKLIIERAKQFQTSDEAVESIKSSIKLFSTQFCSEDKVNIDLRPPKPYHIYLRALIYFDNPHDGQNFINMWNSKIVSTAMLPGMITELKATLETALTCTKEVYLAIEDKIKETLEFFQNNTSPNSYLSIDVLDKTENFNRVTIKFCSNNSTDISDAKKAIQGYIKGDQIICSGNPWLEELFTNKAKTFLKRLKSQVPKCYIDLNHHTKIIMLYGSDILINKVKYDINAYVEALKVEQSNFVAISLRSPSNQKSLLKEIVKEYGFNLQKLCTDYHLSSATIDVHQHVLKIHGSQESQSECKKLIANKMDKIVDDDEYLIDAPCPVCMGNVDNPFYRLEYCGHVYCETCILFQLESVQHVPIKCCVEDCGESLVLQDITWACNKVPALKDTLYKVSFDTFVRESGRVRYCPTPDCTMIYRVTKTEQERKYTCPLCQSDICTKCEVAYHAGFSCDVYQYLTSNCDLTIQKWLAKDVENHKLCPSCKAPIEKNGGCLHMTCWKCNCHMCWRCMKTFPTGDDVYNHQPLCFLQN